VARSLRIALALPGIHRVNRGAETALEQIASSLADLGHAVTVYGSGPHRDGRSYCYRRVPCIPREAFERWPTFPCLRSHYAWEEFTFAAGLLRRFRRDEFDVTVACSYPWMNWLLRRGRGKHVFITQNGDWTVRSRDAEYRFFDCDGLVCTNPQYFARHRERYRAALIPNGVDADLFRPGPADRAAYGLPADVPLILMVSALIPSKRVGDGISAAAQIPGAYLAVAGDGQCRQEIETQAAQFLPGRFRRFNLPRQGMPGLYRCADVFLHTSREEPSANAYMEALATGLPIVTHDWEVTRWTLGDCGTLVDCADPPALVAALRQALVDKSPDAAARRRELVRRRFTWSSIGCQYAEFFGELVDDAPVVSDDPSQPDVAVVAIGRNEGERLMRCLRSVAGKAATVVYVDSGSSDGSIAAAGAIGAQVVQLDADAPFTAARARNAGVERLAAVAPSARFVQFVDGDCELRAGWIARARSELMADPKLAAVCGRRREHFPHRSVYNRLIDMEWNTPIGPAKSVGGDAMFRLEAFRAVGGFDPSVVAGEEPQLCLRLRHAGWKLLRVDAQMTLHDAAMLHLAQWWRRQVRSGYGALDVYTRFPLGGERLFAKPTRSATLWAVGWPIAVIVAGCFAWQAALIVALALPAQMLRLAIWSLRRGNPPGAALAWGVMTMIGKWPWLAGQMRYRRDRAAGKTGRLIEYKQPAVAPAQEVAR
jgi:glycosyltransferase involved in cell wall biosynthesis